MIGYSVNPGPLMDDFNQRAEIAQRKAFMSIGQGIQEEEILSINRYVSELLELKSDFVSNKMEPEANLVYCIVGSIRAIAFELQMMVFIKKDQMAAAWTNLVRAQTILGPVIRNYPLDNTQGIEGYLQRLLDHERLLFPPMQFFSAGYIIKKAMCSICSSDPDDCDHLKGKLYMGELCCRIIAEADLLEGSSVSNPASKLCRVLAIQTGGKTIDPMTLKETEMISTKDSEPS